jgi:hypothetical protein
MRRSRSSRCICSRRCRRDADYCSWLLSNVLLVDAERSSSTIQYPYASLRSQIWSIRPLNPRSRSHARQAMSLSSASCHVPSTGGGLGSQRLLSSIYNACTSYRDTWRDLDAEEHDLVAGQVLSVRGWCMVLRVGAGLLPGLWDVYAYPQHGP